MDFSEEELQQIFDIFKAETEEHLENINKCLLDLEKNPTDEKLLSTLFRDAHTIKGAARMLGIPTIQSIAHKIEDFLKLAKDNSITINSTVIDLIYKAIDLIEKILSTITCTTLDYQDENANNIVIELDLLKDKLLANEKKRKE